YPTDPRLYRHRGHRYITTRKIEFALADLDQAATLVKGQPDQIEPDGQPNARNTPTTTLQSNIWYHLALARYLSGDFGHAADDWQRARDAAKNPDNLVATSHWLYLSLRRANRADDAKAVLAPVRSDLDVIENGSYLSLLLLYKGDRKPAELL